jgi:D-alanyl-lipoteichoic acid acyltransferase DltB (MBOAT superfamily)
MTFNTINYFLFLPAVYLLFFYTSDRWRWAVLLFASAYFYYALDVPYLLPVLFLAVCINYIAGILLSIAQLQGNRKTVLWVGVAANLLILIGLKYLPFLTSSLNTIFLALSLNISPYTSNNLLSIGVSFYIFQGISYLIDIYRQKDYPEKHFGYFALYLSFFPKLLQGPIERAGNLLPQLRSRYIFNYENMRAGILMITGGLFKKLVIADRLALYVNPVYDNVSGYSGTIFVIVTYLYALQLYFDFSGYTDIALGSARMFNIKLTRNFNSPYQATSISDFWRRWHISLSTWLRDYLYIPLGGNRVGSIRKCYNLLIVFLLCGFWHGASWSFIVWGLLHGIYLITSALYKPVQKTLYSKLGLESSSTIQIWQWFLTFNLTCFAWIFFRANTLTDAWYVVAHLFAGTTGTFAWALSQGNGEMVVTIVSLLAMAVLWNLKKKGDMISYLFLKPRWFRWTFYYGMTMSILFFGVFFSEKTFIYFKF